MKAKNKKKKPIFTLEAVGCTKKNDISDNLETIKKMYPKNIIVVSNGYNKNTTIYEVYENDK